MTRSAPREAPSRLLTLSGGHLLVVIAAVAGVSLLPVIVGLFGPPVIRKEIPIDVYSHSIQPELAPSHGTPETETFQFHTPSLLFTFNRELWLIATPSPQSGASLSGSASVSFVVSVPGSSEPLFVTNNQSRTVACQEGHCADLVLFHLGYITVSQLYVKGHITGPPGAFIKEYHFMFASYDTSFSQWELTFRSIFLITTFAVSILFFRSLRFFNGKHWSADQKWTAVLLAALFLYNNPLFPLSFLWTTWLTGALDGVFQATFFTLLLLFWLCYAHGVREKSRRFILFYLPKLIVTGCLWLACTALAVWAAVSRSQDPASAYVLDTTNYLGFRVFLFIGVAVYVTFLLIYLVRAFLALKAKEIFWNLWLPLALTVGTSVVAAVVLIQRFASRILHNNLVDDLSAPFASTAHMTFSYSLLNAYVYAMAYILSPSEVDAARGAAEESGLGTIVTLIDDSEEDVLYGSDGETSLERGRRGSKRRQQSSLTLLNDSD